MEIEMTFEQAAEKLEHIVERINAGSVSLDETVALYEEGVRLSNYCLELLNQYDARIERVSQQLKADCGE